MFLFFRLDSEPTTEMKKKEGRFFLVEKVWDSRSSMGVCTRSSMIPPLVYGCESAGILSCTLCAWRPMVIHTRLYVLGGQECRPCKRFSRGDLT